MDHEVAYHTFSVVVGDRNIQDDDPLVVDVDSKDHVVVLHNCEASVCTSSALVSDVDVSFSRVKDF